MKTSISELAQELNAYPGSDAALFAIFGAIRDGGLAHELAAVLTLWSAAEQAHSVPDRTLAELYFLIATRSSGAHALELCRTALDLLPAHAGALSLFEALADESWTDELCARYQTFLEDAPFHDVPAHVRAAVLDKLVRAQRDAASAVDVSAIREVLCAAQDKDAGLRVSEATRKA